MGIIRFQFNVVEREKDQFFATCSLDGVTSPETPMTLDLDPNEQLGLALEGIRNGKCSQDDLRLVGSELRAQLISGKAGDFYAEKKRQAEEAADPAGPAPHFHLELNLPPALHYLPWETLYDSNIGFLVGDPQHTIIRGHPVPGQKFQFQKRSPGPLRILLIIPERSRLPSIPNEIGNIENAASILKEKAIIRPLTGRVTPDRLKDSLEAEEWDVVHYIGHGDVFFEINKATNETTVRSTTIRFFSDDNNELMMDAEVFAQHFSRARVRMVVLNCCLADAANPNRSLSGVGPFLMRKNVPVVVAMRYEIPDAAASKFALAFYQSLFGPGTMGRVDLATDSGRETLFRNLTDAKIRSFITPVLYLAQDWSQVFNLETDQKKDTKDGGGSGQDKVTIPEAILANLGELKTALQERRCIVVAGSGILDAGATRVQPPPPGPLELAERIANDPQDSAEDRYPRPEDIKLGQTGEQWLCSLLLQWVCGHRSRGQRRGDVISKIQAAYGNLKPTDLKPTDSVCMLADWNVPVLFYTFFDGLLESACKISKTTPTWQPYKGVPSGLELPPKDGLASLRLFIQLRGSVNDDDSLVLTEDEHDILWEGISRMDPVLTAEIKRPKRCLLFLGTDPRDPLIHRLAQKIMDGGDRRKQGPTFFACPSHSTAEEAYWSKYRVQWIHADLAALIAALNNFANSSTPNV